MPENTKRLHQFSHDFVQAYQIAPSPPGFIHTRTNVARKFEGSKGATHNSMAQAFAAEFFTCICLDPIHRVGLTPWLAPSLYETGGMSKGVDIIVSNETPLIAFNVKLSTLKPNVLAPHYEYHSGLRVPVTNVHLGNWRIRPKEFTAEEPDADFRFWLEHLAFPHITTSGKLPYIRHLRDHLMEQIIKTIRIYQEKAHLFAQGAYYPNEQESRVFPKTQEELDILLDKLAYAEAAFCEVYGQIKKN